MQTNRQTPLGSMSRTYTALFGLFYFILCKDADKVFLKKYLEKNL